MFIKATMAALIALMHCLPALSQTTTNFPNRPIRLIVPFPAGGTTDILGRLLSQRLGDAFGQPVVVDNKPGAAGGIGVELALRQPADGHTVVIGGGNHAVNATLFKNPPFNFVTDLVGLGLIGTVQNIMVVPMASPARSPREFVAYAKQKEGKLNYASSGNGATTHLTAEMFKAATGIQMTHVPYKGSSPALTDLMGNQVDVMFDSLASSVQFVKSGKLRALAVTGPTRSPALPDVPTLKELGINVEAVSFVGLYAPKNTPPAVVSRYNTEIRKFVKLPETLARLRDLGVDPRDLNADEMAAFTKGEVDKWGEVIRFSGAVAD